MTIGIFISSTTKDLWQYRQVATKVIADLHTAYGEHLAVQAVSMDTQELDGERLGSVAQSRAWVAEADWVVLIVGWHYGHVAEDQRVSVTEWEYLEAASERDSAGRPRPPKKIFVYLAGDKDDDEYAYRALDPAREKVDLKDFKPGPEVLRFRADLRRLRFRLFKNIEHFDRLLRDALTKRILREIAVRTAPGVARLGLQTEISNCFRDVRTLAGYKKIHDALHRIRQYGVRRIREQLAAQWPCGGTVPVGMSDQLRALDRQISKQVGRIGELLKRLPPAAAPPSADLLHIADSELPVSLAGTKAQFIEDIDNYASRVQKAFTYCNWRMCEAARSLAAHFDELRAATPSALRTARMPAEAARGIEAQLVVVEGFHDRLQEVLVEHEHWQKAHDALERFDDDLAQVADKENAARLHDDLLADLRDRQAVNQQPSALRSLLERASARAARDDRLHAWHSPLFHLRQHLGQFEVRPKIESYGGLRKAFDDLFFEVDNESLFAVELSEGRVDAMDEGLRRFQQAVEARHSPRPGAHA
jgi:hypothetical protein